MSRLKIFIFDTNKKKIFCRVILLEGLAQNDTHKKKYFEGDYCDGEIEFNVAPGTYTIQIYKGKLYWPFKTTVEIIEGEETIIEAELVQMLNPRDLDLYCFDAHSHVSRTKMKKDETSNLRKASIVMKGEDFDFFFAGSPYDLDTHQQAISGIHTDVISYREKYASIIKYVNDETFMLDIGNEIIKGRYGHVFMINYEQMPPFDKYYDEKFDRWQFHKKGKEPKYELLYMHEAVLQEKGEHSVAALAHPTSWWYQDGAFITNIATTLGFDILAGSIDAMVIMGYEADRVWYHKIWYDALNNGYFLPGIAELDMAFDDFPRSMDAYKTYVYSDEFSKDSLAEGIKHGRCMVTSGPILELKVNSKLPGSVHRYKRGEKFAVEIIGYRCFEAQLSKMQLIINGIVYKEYFDINDNGIIKEKITIKKDSYVIAKCYDKANNVAITSPVYIRNEPFANTDFKSNVTIKVRTKFKKAKGEYCLGDSKQKIAFNGVIKVNIPVINPIHIFSEGTHKAIHLFEMKRLQKIFSHLYLGRFNKNKKYKSGEVPSSAFQMPKIRKILKKVKIKVNI